MKTLLRSVIGAALLSLSMINTAHASSVYFKNPIQFAGTGCPAGSIAIVGANTPTLSILFDQYDAGKDSTSGKSRTACSFAVPIKVPRGFQISHLTADWQGYVSGKGELKRKYFLAGEPYTGWKTNTHNSPSGGNFLDRDNILHASLATGCDGGQYNLRINSQIRALGGNSYAAVDSADLNNKILFMLKFKKCQ
jgi:hypothetical protein